MSRTIQKVFGFIAIATGFGIVVAGLSGVGLPVIILPSISVVVLGWAFTTSS